MKHMAREVVLYGLASAAAFVVDVMVLAALVELAGAPYLPAAVTGFIVGSLVAYRLCVRFIFSHRRLEDRRVEATAFVVLGVAGLLVNAGGIYLGVESLQLHYLVAKVAAAGLSFVTNYSIRRLALFTDFRNRMAGDARCR